eukprot:TRINITY_DN1093_c0_g3_i1.p1 TRINITY_DN1093_c0_g3~~TRINITY_DN1093_c0_g3_i1.p1  ORF type:complete len:597 (-),score=113.47 TRINITY_DN1093_c0_g3_i1:616-2406(-)
MAGVCPLEGQVLGGQDSESQFVLGPALGKGSFGEVRSAERVSDGLGVAVKLQEATDAEGRATSSHLNNEHAVMSALAQCQGFPKAFALGSTQNHYYLVMSRLGPSLHEVHEKCGNRFSIKSITMLALRSISRLESLHSKGFVHCDIKPENFLMGPGNDINKLFLVDFGLSFRWQAPNGKHIRYRDGKHGITGTLRYCSLNAHGGIELSRRDDLESLFYTLIFLAKGQLPWQGQTGTKEAKRQKVFEKKKNIPLQELCKELPVQYIHILEYIRGLKFDAAPNYDYCRDLMNQALAGVGERDDEVYDWMSPDSRILGHLQRMKRPIDGHAEYTPPAKRQRNFHPEELQKTQWVITVTRNHEGMVQRYAREQSYNNLVDWLKRNEWGSDSGLYITSINHSMEGEANSMWTCVLSSNTDYISQQIKKCSSPLSAEEWVKRKRQNGYQVTCISGHVQNSCVVVVISRKKEDPPLQAMTFAEIFPRMWVEAHWKLGYYITSLGNAGVYWLVVMSKNPETYTRQWFQTSHTYPAKSIKERWATGFRITSIASKDKLFAIIMSQLTNRATSQGYNCSYTWPHEYVEEAQQQHRYVSSITWKIDG